ncbi:MAG: adenylate kinase [Elusimicrobiota bacterium]
MISKIVMLGIVGAGKGTQAKRLSRYLDIPHISTGEIFREAVKKKTPLGLKAKSIMEAGDLVPDDIVIGIVEERLKEDDAQDGYILDGFPRTITQAKEFDKLEDLDRVFYITIPEEESVKRLKGRRICSKCKKEYNIYLADDDTEECPCGGKLIQREDDKEETVKIRIDNYIEQTEPLIEYYRKNNLLVEIDGDQEIDEVFSNIKETL